MIIKAANKAVVKQPPFPAFFEDFALVQRLGAPESLGVMNLSSLVYELVDAQPALGLTQKIHMSARITPGRSLRKSYSNMRGPGKLAYWT